MPNKPVYTLLGTNVMSPVPHNERHLEWATHTDFPYWHWTFTAGCVYISTLFWMRSVVWFVFNANFTIKSCASYKPNYNQETECTNKIPRKLEGLPDLHINPSHTE